MKVLLLKLFIIFIISAVGFMMNSCVVVDDGPGNSENAPGQIKKKTGL